MAIGTHDIPLTLLDTASNPDDTTLLAAQGAGEVGYLQWITFNITVPQASSRIVIEDGVGGNVILAVLSTAVGTQHFNFSHGDGLKTTAATLLNASIIGATGVVVTVQGQIRFRG
jgi:hypothetical protein